MLKPKPNPGASAARTSPSPSSTKKTSPLKEFSPVLQKPNPKPQTPSPTVPKTLVPTKTPVALPSHTTAKAPTSAATRKQPTTRPVSSNNRSASTHKPSASSSGRSVGKPDTRPFVVTDAAAGNPTVVAGKSAKKAVPVAPTPKPPATTKAPARTAPKTQASGMPIKPTNKPLPTVPETPISLPSTPDKSQLVSAAMQQLGLLHSKILSPESLSPIQMSVAPQSSPSADLRAITDILNSVRPLINQPPKPNAQPNPGQEGGLVRVRSSEKEFVALGQNEGNMLEFFPLKDLVGAIQVDNLFDSFDGGSPKEEDEHLKISEVVDTLQPQTDLSLMKAVGENFYNTALISKICELGIFQLKDPDINERFLLNNNAAFDISDPGRKWQNWTVKTFVPTPAANANKPLANIRALVSTSTKESWPKQEGQFRMLLTTLTVSQQPFSDARFKPSIQSLRGFGGDASWE